MSRRASATAGPARASGITWPSSHRSAQAATVLDDRHKTTDGPPWKRRKRMPMLDAMTAHTDSRTGATTGATTETRTGASARTAPTTPASPTMFRPDPTKVRRAIERRSVATLATVSAAGRIPVRPLPVGPPASIQFQSSAVVLANDDPEVVRLADAGRLRTITAHGELDLDGGCFLRIELPDRAVTYALGMSLWQVMRHPLDSAGGGQLRPRRPSNQPR